MLLPTIAIKRRYVGIGFLWAAMRMVYMKLSGTEGRNFSCNK